jgi:hypothetical protein
VRSADEPVQTAAEAQAQSPEAISRRNLSQSAVRSSRFGLGMSLKLNPRTMCSRRARHSRTGRAGHEEQRPTGDTQKGSSSPGCRTCNPLQRGSHASDWIDCPQARKILTPDPTALYQSGSGTEGASNSTIPQGSLTRQPADSVIGRPRQLFSEQIPQAGWSPSRSLDRSTRGLPAKTPKGPPGGTNSPRFGGRELILSGFPAGPRFHRSQHQHAEGSCIP